MPSFTASQNEVQQDLAMGDQVSALVGDTFYPEAMVMTMSDRITDKVEVCFYADGERMFAFVPVENVKLVSHA